MQDQCKHREFRDQFEYLIEDEPPALRLSAPEAREMELLSEVARPPEA